MLWHWQIWSELPIILARDTLWQLSFGPRVMLVALSTCAVVATALCCLVKSMWFQQWFYTVATFHPILWIRVFLLDMATTLVLLWAAVSLAPQLFYMLYVAVIDGLSQQWVAKPVDCLTFQGYLKLTLNESMATLTVGIMMLTILVASVGFWLTVIARSLQAKTA